MDAVKTNTFRANAESFPNPETLANVITEGYRLAKKAAEGTTAEVYADIGGISDEDKAEEYYLQAADIFLSLGATNFLFETLSHFTGIETAAKRIKEKTKNAPTQSSVIISFTVSQDGYSPKGIYYKQLINQAAASPFTDAVGLNCTCGPAHLLKLAKGISGIPKPLSIMPNAGYPAVINGRTFFNDNANYFGEKLLEISKLGVEILGGCCGTTPEHIRQARKTILSFKSFSSNPSSSSTKNENIISSQNELSSSFSSPSPVATEASSIFSRGQQGDVSEVKVSGEHFHGPPLLRRTLECPVNTQGVEKRPPDARNGTSTNFLLQPKPIFVELDPPLDCDHSFIFSSAAALKSLGVSAVTLADSPLSRPRADSVLTAARLKSETGIDVLPHITCRDKNAIALRGSLLGAHAFGIDKVLIVTGDRPAEDGVFSFNSLKLISFVENLNKEIFTERPFSVGGALNVNAANFDSELKRAEQKLNNGASFLLTQAIFSEDAVRNFIRAKNELNCKLFAGILPIVSYKNAVFLNNEVAGIKIPQGIVDSFKDKKKAEETSVRLASETVREVYACADGFYIMTPLKKTGLVCSLIERCFNG